MTSTVSCSDSDKERFEAMQEPGENQVETMNRILDMAEAFEGDIIDETELAEETAELMGPKLELAMKRVANEMNTPTYHVTANGEVDDEQLDELRERMKEVELEYNE